MYRVGNVKDEYGVPYLKPFLYHIRVLLVCDAILQDKSIAKNAEFDSIRKYCRTLASDYLDAVDQNSLLLVECLLKQNARSITLMQENYRNLLFDMPSATMDYDDAPLEVVEMHPQVQTENVKPMENIRSNSSMTHEQDKADLFSVHEPVLDGVARKRLRQSEG